MIFPALQKSSSTAKIIQHWLLGTMVNDFSQPCNNHSALSIGEIDFYMGGLVLNHIWRSEAQNHKRRPHDFSGPWKNHLGGLRPPQK